MNMLKRIGDAISRRMNPVEYWRKKGTCILGGCEIYRSANLGSEPYLISLGNHVRVNSGVQFITHDGGVWVLRECLKEKDADKIDLFGMITVGNNVHIGTNAIIMPGVTIGNNCIIGCGAIVTKDIPDCSVAVGVPARVIESIDEYTEKNRLSFKYTKKYTNEEKEIYLKSIYFK